MKNFCPPNIAKFFLFLTVLLPGCANYEHARYSEGKLIERTSVNGLFQTSAVGKLHSKTVDGPYTKTIDIGNVNVTGDAALFNAIYQAGKAEALKGAGIP